MRGGEIVLRGPDWRNVVAYRKHKADQGATNGNRRLVPMHFYRALRDIIRAGAYSNEGLG